MEFLSLLKTIRRLRDKSQIAAAVHRMVRNPYYRIVAILYPRGVPAQLADGTRVRIHPRYVGMSPETFEQDLVQILLKHLKPGAFVIDVGAHVGLHTLLFSSHVEAAGRVIACEASPANANQLRRHLAWNRRTNVEVVQAAIVDAEGTLDFIYRPDPMDPGAFANSLAYDIGGITTQVRATTLDQVAATGMPDLIKIDVEGAELLVLRGAWKILTRSAPILVVAIHPEPMRLTGTSPRELVEFMDSCGYNGYRLDGSQAIDPGFEEVVFEKRKSIH